jgi:uncharacterized protein YukE
VGDDDGGFEADPVATDAGDDSGLFGSTTSTATGLQTDSLVNQLSMQTPDTSGLFGANSGLVGSTSSLFDPTPGVGTGFQVDPVAVQNVATQTSGINGLFGSAVTDLGGLTLDGAAYGTFGSAVATAGASMQNQATDAFNQVQQLFGTINQNVGTAATNYADADAAVARGFGQATATPVSATTTDPTTTADPNAADPNAQNTVVAQNATQQPAQPAQPAQPTQNGLDPRVVDSIMQSEGASGEQGGVREVYGFRQSEHNGYDQIMAARNQYGQGSPEERAVVAGLLEQHAQQAGALNFTDPGTQAAIMSSAHMRGPAGTAAILNSMVDGTTPTRTGTLSQNTIQQIQQMSPQDFQQQFHDARINYDQTIYGNTITHQGGHTDTWWNRYGNGLTQRYGREQQQFLGISQGNQP